MPETTLTFLMLRIDGWGRLFAPPRPVSVGAHRYCNVLLPGGDGEVPLRAAVFEWNGGAWVLSNASKRTFVLHAEGQPALTLAPGGSVALAGTPFVLSVGGTPAKAHVEVSTQVVDAAGDSGPMPTLPFGVDGTQCVCGAALPADPGASALDSATASADLALFRPWSAEDPGPGGAATSVAQAEASARPPSVGPAWVPLTLPPPVTERSVAVPTPDGAWWVPPPGTSAGAATRHRAVITALLVVIAMLASAAGAAAWRSVGRRPAAPPHPAQWDPRLADIVAFVEKERGHTFQHPVFVDYLPPDAFRRTLVADPGDISAKDRQEMERMVGFFRALGLVEGTPDLFGSTDQLSGDGTLAYYNPIDQRVRVRGTELTEAVKATLAHELTHALQDQYFELSRHTGTEGDTVDRFRAVVEGDAMRVEHLWVDHLDPAARKAFDTGRDDEANAADFSAVPEVLTVLYGAPYSLGEPFVDLLAAVGGNEAVDRALKSPPASEEQLLDPFRYLAGDAPLPVAEPALEKGEKRLDGGNFGAFGLYLMLSQRLAARDALKAVDGWGGDNYVYFTRQGRSCVRADFAGDNPGETDQLSDALQAWARAMPPGAASVVRHDGTVELDACDPGVGAKIGGPRLADAVSWPVVRTYSAVGAIKAGASQDDAACYAAGLLEAFGPDKLTSESKLSAADERQMGKIALRCKTH
jgi:hypothetical protein